tara:strand:- start:2804 stop:3082 length:279 start_codon:yes stop_codon:yes gene_type:complete
MATFSKKVMGKEVGDAKVYAKPHTMDGKAMKNKSSNQKDPNSMSASESTPGGTSARRVSAGNPARDDVKTAGIETRGNGAATKGRIARGPMA